MTTVLCITDASLQLHWLSLSAPQPFRKTFLFCMPTHSMKLSITCLPMHNDHMYAFGHNMQTQKKPALAGLELMTYCQQGDDDHSVLCRLQQLACRISQLVQPRALPCAMTSPLSLPHIVMPPSHPSCPPATYPILYTSRIYLQSYQQMPKALLRLRSIPSGPDLPLGFQHSPPSLSTALFSRRSLCTRCITSSRVTINR